MLKKVKEVVVFQPYVDTLTDPFKVLVSTIISARTKDETTGEASKRLFRKIKDVNSMIKADEKHIQDLIYPVSFYKNKAKHLKQMAKMLKINYNGKVPTTITELVKLPGVGRKTANLVISVAFNKPGICVDTHVHRITNRWGLVDTKTPKETEMRLKKILIKSTWSNINRYLVPFGKEICTPISPKCSKCPLQYLCPKIGVSKHR